MALRHPWRLEEVACGDGAEDADGNTTNYERAEDGLDEDGVLDLAESGLLDPDLAVENLAHNVSLLVFGDPRLVLPRVAGRMRTERISRVELRIVALRLVIRAEQLPWSQVAVVHAVEDYTHTLPGGDERGNANDKANQRHDPPGAACAAQSEDDGDDKTSDDTADSETARKDDTRAVAVADCPANEIGVGLAAQRPLNGSDNILECGWVSGILQCVEQCRALLRREIELTRSAIRNVDRNDAVNLLAIGLNGYCLV